jgi:inorganic pyrophosphatase
MIPVFIENPAGLSLEHHFDEQSGTLRAISQVARPYPYAYGFVPHAPAADGDNLVCFVLTRHALKSGDLVECEVLGLMEQWEDGAFDHNGIARPIGEEQTITAETQAALVEFVRHVFDNVPGKVVRAGRFLEADEAHRHVLALLRAGS